MVGPSDIATILSQAGRIEKVNHNPFVQSEVNKQILTEEEARERLRRSKEVIESRKTGEIRQADRRKESMAREKKRDQTEKPGVSPDDGSVEEKKHLIDVVV
ncbi:MAG TPA: hypothetical protein ENN34_12475 [Deltaproteobacteria bacterium]|nr:hypothetical protein [Deltaproteobacteria bacterium]